MTIYNAFLSVLLCTTVSAQAQYDTPQINQQKNTIYLGVDGEETSYFFSDEFKGWEGAKLEISGDVTVDRDSLVLTNGMLMPLIIRFDTVVFNNGASLLAKCNLELGALNYVKGDVNVHSIAGMAGKDGEDVTEKPARGTNGAPGKAGSNGSSGDLLNHGKAGTPGTNGGNGKDGVDGFNGTHGERGKNGTHITIEIMNVGPGCNV